MTTFGTKMVYRKYSKNYTVTAYNFTFYPHSCLDITYCSRYKISNEGTCQHEKNSLLLCMQKLAEVRAGNVCVKWSILPHLNVKKDAMKKMKDFIMKVRNNCFHLFHNCQHNFYATLITVTI